MIFDPDNSAIVWVLVITILLTIFGGEPDITDALRAIVVQAAGLKP